jgi:hypothetical protein
MERREEAASQARVGGAIQSLLSGGSALDKIGWLNTSKKPSENEKKPAQQGPNSIKNPPHVDMGGVPKDKALITGSVSVSYDTKVPTKRTRFSGGEDSPSGEHAHSEDAGYITVPNVENFIHVQTHDGKSGWYPDIYNNTRRTNYYPGSKEDALTNIAAHPGAPKADELHPTLADAIASDRSIPKDYKISPHSNKPPKPFDGAAVLEEYYRNHPDKRPPEAKPKEEAAPAKEPSILDTINQRNEQAAAMRGKVPSMEHPSQRSAREGGPEGGHSPRVLTRTERDYRDSQNQWDNDRRRMGIPVPGDELATLEIPGKIKVEDGELAGSKILSLGNKRAGVMQHADGSFVVLSQVDRKTVDRKEFKSLDEANGFAEGWLKGGQGAPKQQEKPKLPYQELLDQPLPNDTYKLVDLLDKIKDTDERPVKGFEFPKDDPRYTKLKEIRAKIREIDAQTGASTRNMAAQQEMDIMEGGREFENPSAYRSWAPPKYRPGPREAKPTPTREAPKPTPSPIPAKKPKPPAETPRNPNAGNGSPATFEEMFGKSPDHIKVSGSIDHTKPFVLTVEGKTFDHRERLKALGFKYSSANKNWYKGIVPSEGNDAKADLLNHIKEVSSEPGASSQLRAKVQQGKLVPKKRTMSASEASLFGVKR